MIGLELAPTVFPRTVRVTESEGGLCLVKESTESDFLRAGRGFNDSGETGEASSVLAVVGVAFISEKLKESAVMKVS